MVNLQLLRSLRVMIESIIFGLFSVMKLNMSCKGMVNQTQLSMLNLKESEQEAGRIFQNKNELQTKRHQISVCQRTRWMRS